LEKRGIAAKLMPVPRKLSSSCGTCVCYEHDSAVDADACELEGVYFEAHDGFDCVLRK
jgi:hypothetical protein